jgi:glutaredoxin 3
MKTIPILYIKRGCPWCRQAKSFFDQHGVELDIRDVGASNGNMKRMIEVSEQTMTPTFEYGDFVVADFSVDEFLAELEERPDVRLELGIGDDED